jgi:hypothetical protein
VRLAHPKARREAITSRPCLLASVGHEAEHAGKTTLARTGLHAHFGQVPVTPGVVARDEGAEDGTGPSW